MAKVEIYIAKSILCFDHITQHHYYEVATEQLILAEWAGEAIRANHRDPSTHFNLYEANEQST
jgi:hypothetical protein